jgi:polyhydroxybutyrate depolymerase
MRRRLSAALFVIVIVGAASCSSSKSASRSSSPATATTSTTTTTVPGQAPSSGCRRRGASEKPAPLVLAFHGYGSDGREFASLTKLPALGAKRGIVVLTPSGANHTWQLSGTGTDASAIDKLVATTEQSKCIDLHRVYAAGFSQGAAFAIFYSCARPDRIAALATVAVEFLLGCKQPVPILAFHGTDDPAVPYRDGAVGASLPGAKVRGTLFNMADWARLDGCRRKLPDATIRTEIVVSRWTRCAGDTEVRLYTVKGGSHTWPGANRAASPLYTTQQISATTLMLNFFARHHLGGAG